MRAPAGVLQAMHQRAREQARADKAAAIKAESEKALDTLAGSPEFAAPAVSREVYREMLLSTEGWIMAQGYSWDLVGKSLGVGVYRVTLRRRA